MVVVVLVTVLGFASGGTGKEGCILVNDHGRTVTVVIIVDIACGGIAGVGSDKG